MMDDRGLLRISLKRSFMAPWGPWTAGDLGANITRTLSVNMQNKHGGSIRAHDCPLKRCDQNSLTQYLFHVMESGTPEATPVILIGLLRLKKRSTEKKTSWEKLPKVDRFESLRLL